MPDRIARARRNVCTSFYFLSEHFFSITTQAESLTIKKQSFILSIPIGGIGGEWMEQYLGLIVLGVLMGAWMLVRSHRAKKFKISPDEAKRLLDTTKGIILLDVRSEEEYRERHIPKSLLMPLNSLKAQAPKRLPDKNKEILVYCRSGNRSAAAVRILSKLGYVKVKNIGGIIHWPFATVSGK